MKLRQKTVLIISVTVASLVLAIVAFSWFFLLESFNEIEKAHVDQMVSSAKGVIERDAESLNVIVEDWSHWDDTYEFAVDENQDYIDDNLTADVFENIDLDVMMLVTPKGKVVYAGGFDFETWEEIDAPEGLLSEHLVMGSEIMNLEEGESLEGIIMLPDGPMIIGAQTVLENDKSGPSHGVFLWGRFLNSDRIKTMSSDYNLSIAVEKYNNFKSSHPEAIDAINSNGDILSQAVNGNKMEGYTVVKDIYGKKVLVLQTEKARDIYQQGRNSIIYFVFFIVISGLIYAIVMLLTLDKMLVSRLSSLGLQVKEVGDSGDISRRVSVSGRDELAGLAKIINTMLVQLQSAQEDLKKTGEELEGIGKELSTEVGSQDDNRLSKLKDNIKKLREDMAERERRMGQLKTEVEGVKGLEE